VTEFFEGFKQKFLEFTMAVLIGFTGFIESVLNAFPQFIIAVAAFFITMWTQISGALATVKQTVINFFIDLITQIVTAGINAGIAMRDFGQKILNGLSEAWNNVTSFISTTFSTIASKIGQAIGDTTHIGREIINGIWEGFKANIGSFFGNIASFGQNVIEKFKEIFNIHSPSRLMEDEVGKNIGLGVGVGLTGATRTVESDAEKFSKNISKAVSIGSSFDITPNEDSFLGRGVQAGNTVEVYQTVEQPKNMMDMYVNTKRAAIAGTAAAGGF
jgi:phage-related protein